MADFCQQCSLVMFGIDTKDMANLLEPEKYTDDMGVLALCECCGPVVVDINGRRMSDEFDSRCDCADLLAKNKASA